MAEIVYILCALTSGVCAVLLLVQFRRTKTPLLMWSGVCFTALTVTNILLFIDLVVTPQIDLSLLRNSVAFIGASTLLYSLIRSSK
jgi:hypothetical protein